MLSPETLESYRRMTPAERLRLTLSLQAENERFLQMGTAEQVERKFDLLRRENDATTQAIVEAIAKSKTGTITPE